MATNQTTDVLERLRQGVTNLTNSDAWTQWLNVQRRFHSYSWGNCLLIALQRPDATRIAGYRRWLEMGRHVRKGEKGIAILAPIVNRVKVENEQGEQQELGHMVSAFRPAYVFDVSQTEGEDLPEVTHRLTGTDPDGAFQALIDVASSIGFNVEFSDSLGEVNGDCNHDLHRIRVNDGIEDKQRIKTLAHEIGHALLHGPETRQADSTRGLIELEAESVAYVVCSELGLDSGQYSFGYVAGWAGGGESASKMISSSAQRINMTARRILTELGVEGHAEHKNATPSTRMTEPVLA
jgi:antirestriction protein ArdC